MKINNKGFTMIELLAVLALMAILISIATMAVSKYLEKTRQESYETMETSSFSAAQNYIQDKGKIIPADGSVYTINVSDLVADGYLPTLEDPHAKGSNCNSGSTVKVSRTKGTGSTLDQYTYLVTIKCKKYTSHHYNASGDKVTGVYFYS